MTAAMVPQDREPILRHNYDSRMGHAGAYRMWREAYPLLRSEGFIPHDASFTKTFDTSDPITGILNICVPAVAKTFRCVASIQPSPQTEMLIYEVDHKQQAGA